MVSSQPSCGKLDVFNLVLLPSSWLPLKILVLSVIIIIIIIIIILFTFLFTSSIHSPTINGVGSLPTVYQLYR